MKKTRNGGEAFLRLDSPSASGVEGIQIVVQAEGTAALFKELAPNTDSVERRASLGNLRVLFRTFPGRCSSISSELRLPPQRGQH